MIITPGDLRRHLAVQRAVLVQALRRDAQFRAQAWTVAVVALAELGLGLVPVLVVTGSAPGGINGWSPRSMIAVAGCFQITLSLLNAFVAPNLMRISEYVQRGDLDGMLLRPVDPQWTTLFRWVRPAALSGAGGGVVLVVIGLQGTPITPTGVLLAVLWLGCGYVLATLAWANLAYLAFWLEAASFIHDLVLEVLSAGRYPVTFFPHLVRVLLIFVVPIAVATTLPVQALTSGVPAPTAVSVLALTVAAVVLTRVHWRLALRRYASASS